MKDIRKVILLLNIDQPHIVPTANLPQTIVMAAGPADVQDVITGVNKVLAAYRR